eukprot:jgi/Mesvir1/12849/Mv05879-RA.2
MGNVCCSTPATQGDDETYRDKLPGKERGEVPSQANGHLTPLYESNEVIVGSADTVTPKDNGHGPHADRIQSDDEYWTCETNLSGVDFEVESADGASPPVVGTKELSPRRRSQGITVRPFRADPQKLLHTHSQIYVPTWKEKLNRMAATPAQNGNGHGPAKELNGTTDTSRGTQAPPISLNDVHGAPQGGVNHHRHRWWSHSTQSENKGGWHLWPFHHGHGAEGAPAENGERKVIPRVRSMEHNLRLAPAQLGSAKPPRRCVTGVNKAALEGAGHRESLIASHVMASVRIFFHDLTSAWSWRSGGTSRDSIDRQSDLRSRRLVRPVAGATLALCSLAALQPGSVAETDYSFSVRGGNYFRDKKKISSMAPGYKLLGADIFTAGKKISHIAPHLQLPEVPPSVAAAAGSLPPLLVINIQMPSYEPSLFGRADDGDGCSLVFYYVLSEDFVAQKDSPEFKLAQRFLSPSDESHKSKEGRSKVRDQLKIVARLVNSDELEMSSTERNLIYMYNEKPVLSRPQHAFFEGEGYLEIDVDVHRFSYVAVKGLYSFKDRMSQVCMDLGFVIQGNDKSELPERMLATVRFCKIPVFTSGNILELMDL